MKRYLGFVGILGGLVLGGANLGFCGIVTVTGTDTVFTTIQAGVDACPTGGTVSVAAGIYNEAVYINKGIALVGIGTPTITASGLGYTSTVTFVGTFTDNASISGFKITGATGSWPNGLGIYCNNGSPSITNNTISGNACGIACDSSSPSIFNNIISGNTYSGILCDSSSPAITNNTITGNKYCGIWCSSSSPSITNNIITGNYWGIVCYSYSSPFITNNTISGNRYGIFCEDYSSPLITNNIIRSHTSYGIYEDDTNSDPHTNHNCFYNNTSGDYYDEGTTVRTVGWLNTIYTGNISADPQFISISDFHLKSSSPCIDAGLNTAPAIPSTDKDGKPRKVNGIVDMGAYEYQGTLFKIVSLPATTTTYATFTITVSLCDNDGNPYSGILAMTNTTQSITPGTITIIEGTGTATAIITQSPEGGTDTITVSYGTIIATRTISGYL